MKKTVSLILVLLCSCFFAGCGSKEAVVAGESTSMTLKEQVEGFYRAVKEEPAEDERVMKIQEVCGVLLLEHCSFTDTGEKYAVYTQEVWPDDAAALYGNDLDSVHGVSQVFWPPMVTSRGQGTVFVTAELTDTGLHLAESVPYYDDEMERLSLDYERTEDEGWFGKEMPEVEKYISGDTDVPELAGSWVMEDERFAVWMELKEDGTAVYAQKWANSPMWLDKGIWRAEDDGTLWLLTETVGSGLGYRMTKLHWNVADGSLQLRNRSFEAEAALAETEPYVPAENYLPLEAVNTFVPAEENWVFPATLANDLRPVLEFENMGYGTIEDTANDQTMDYSYYLWWMREDIPGAEVFNQQLQDGFVEVIQKQMAYINAEKFPEYDSIWCEPFIYGDLYTYVVTMERWIDNQNEYEVYYFDKENEKMMNSTELLDKVGISYFEEFLPAAAEAGKRMLLDSNDGLAPEFQAELQDALQRTVWYVGQYPVYPVIDFDGSVAAIMPVASMAGPDYIYQHLLLDLTAN